MNTRRQIPQSPGGFHERSPFLREVRDLIRLRHLSWRTEQSYIGWSKRFILFHHKRHPKEMGVAEVRDFLTYLAVSRNVSATTQNQALKALVFLYHQFFGTTLGDLGEVPRAKRPKRIPVVLSRDEVQRLLANMSGTHGLMARLLYGTGMRLMESVRLRVKDLDTARNQIVVRAGKGDKNVSTTMIYTHVLNRPGLAVRSPLDSAG